MEELINKIKDYAVISLIMSTTSLVLNPYNNAKRALRNMIISFFIPMLAGFLIDGLDLPQMVKYGVVGSCGLTSVWLYETIQAIFKYLKKNPGWLLDKLSSFK